MSTSNTIGAVRQQLAQEGVAFSGEIASAAARHGLDPQLLAAVAAQETGGPATNAGANIIGDGGHGRGLFQIDDRWHAFAKTAAAMNPAKNADYAAAMLSGLLKRYCGNVHKALSAYNAGSPDATGTVTQWSDGQKLGYADSVLRHLGNLRGSHRQGALAQSPSTLSTLSPQEQENLLGELLSEIQQTNQLQSCAQGSPLCSAMPTTQQFSPPSYAQIAGIDSTGHTKSDRSWAGIIDE